MFVLSLQCMPIATISFGASFGTLLFLSVTLSRCHGFGVATSIAFAPWMNAKVGLTLIFGPWRILTLASIVATWMMLPHLGHLSLGATDAKDLIAFGKDLIGFFALPPTTTFVHRFFIGSAPT